MILCVTPISDSKASLAETLFFSFIHQEVTNQVEISHLLLADHITDESLKELISHYGFDCIEAEDRPVEECGIPNFHLAKVHNLRKQLVDEALRREWDHLLWWDADVFPPEGAVDSLLSLDSPVASALVPDAWTHSPQIAFISSETDKYWNPYYWHIPSIVELPNDRVFTIQMGTFSFLLVRRDVVESIKWEYVEKSERKEDDVFFFTEIAKQGIKAVCSTGIHPLHVNEDLIGTRFIPDGTRLRTESKPVTKGLLDWTF
jgi:hypothetical protein